MTLGQLQAERTIRVGKDDKVRHVAFASSAPVLLCGPCVVESEEHLLRHASRIREIAAATGWPLVFKSSYDKANRTSLDSFRGIGMERALSALSQVRNQLGVPVVTDVHDEHEVELVAKHVDMLQIPAFLCRQTNLIVAAAETGLPLLVKKGQFLAPQDMEFALQKAASTGNRSVVFCERGTCFGYRELIVDYRGLEVMRNLGPVVFDATHSVQVMGGAGGSSSGNRRYVALLARAAVAVGVDGIFLECHEDPDRAPSDGPNMLPLAELEPLLSDLRVLAETRLATRDTQHR